MDESNYSGIINSTSVTVIGNTFLNQPELILQWVNNTIITRNQFYNSSFRLLQLNWNDGGIIHHNVFYHNSDTALHLLESNNFNVSYNAFLDNNADNSPQALDSGTNNTFECNFWSDAVRVDADKDGISDLPYSLGGSANNTDSTPLMYWVDENVHVMTTPYLIEPREGEELSGAITIRWWEAFDTQNHSIQYELWFARYGTIDWHLIASNLTTTSFTWDTTQFSLEFIILKVVARDSEGYSKEFKQVKRIVIY